MKKFSIIAALVIAAPGVAQAQNYVELRAGGVWLEDADGLTGADAGGTFVGGTASFDTGWLAAVAAGRDFTGPLRAEIEYSHRQIDVGDVAAFIANPAPPPTTIPFVGSVAGDVVVDALMLNAYVDTLIAGGPVSLYAGLGAGAAFTETTFDGVVQTDTKFAFQFMAGASYEVTPTIDLTAGYNIFVVEDVPLGGSDMVVTAHNAAVGLRFGF